MLKRIVLAPARRMFADQFQLEDCIVVYRKGLSGAPIRVTEAERDQFISAFNAALARAFWVLPAAMLGAVAVLVGVMGFFDTAFGSILSYGVLSVISGIFVLTLMWLWNAPARVLRHRTPSGGKLTRAERRRIMLQGMTGAQLLLMAVLPAIAILQLQAEYDLSYGWNRLWWVGAGAFEALIAVRAYLKWRQGRE